MSVLSARSLSWITLPLFCLACAGGGSPAPSHPQDDEKSASRGNSDRGHPSPSVGSIAADIESPETFPRALERAEDLLAKGGAKEKKQLADALSGPATRTYEQHGAQLSSDEKFRLMELIVALDHPETLPFLEKKLSALLGDDRSLVPDARIVLLAYSKGHLDFLAPTMLTIFENFRGHTRVGGIAYKDLSKAVGSHPHPSWESTLIQMLSAPVEHPSLFETKAEQRAAIDPYRDQLVWQVTSALALGKLQSKAAVEPLLRVILDPGKGDVATTALLALVKIGKPALERTAKILSGDDPLIVFSQQAIEKATGKKPTENSALPSAVAVIGMIGLDEGAKPLLAALAGKRTDEDKALIARELPKLPPSAETKKAFQKAFESISAETNIQGTPALAILAEALAKFHDASLVPWLLEQAEKDPGDGEVRVAIQQSILSSAIKLARADQWKEVEAAAKKYKVDDLARTAALVVSKCGDRVDCYLEEVERLENQTSKNQLAGIKAAYMIAVLGDGKARDDLVKRLERIENDAVHFAALGSVDFLTRTPAPHVVERLRQLIERNEASGDPSKLVKNSPLKQILYRLEAR